MTNPPHHRPLPALVPPDPLGPSEEGRKAVTRYAANLTDLLHQRIAEARAERAERLGDTPLGRTDVAPLVRSLAGFADTMDHAARLFRTVATEAREQAGEEVRVTGERRVVVPDGFGKEVVAKVGAARTRKVDPVALMAALVAIRSTEYDRALTAQDLPPEDGLGATLRETYRTAYSNAQQDILAVTSSVSPSVSKIDALSRTLQAHGQDDLAGLLDRSMRWESGEEKTTITVEDPKRARR